MNDPIVEKLCATCGRPNCPKHCDECGGEIDTVTLACLQCGLEARDIKDRNLVREDGDTNVFSGTEKDRSIEGSGMGRDAMGVQSSQYGTKMGQLTKSNRARGYTCYICEKMFDRENERFAMEKYGGFNMNQSNIEKAGSDLTRFYNKQDLNDHYHAVHRVRYINYRKRPPIVVMMDGSTRSLNSYRWKPSTMLNSDEDDKNPVKEGTEKRDTNVQTAGESAPRTTGTDGTSTANSAISSSHSTEPESRRKK